MNARFADKVFRMVFIFIFMAGLAGRPNASVMAQSPVQELRPHMAVFLFHNGVGAFQWPLGSQITLTVDDPDNGPGVDYRDTQPGVPDPVNPRGAEASFQVTGLTLQPGQLLTMTDGTTTKTHTIPSVVLGGGRVDNDTVWGTADPGAVIDVVNTADYSIVRHAMTDAQGNWLADFSASGDAGQVTYDILYGDDMMIMQDDEDGDHTQFNWHANVPSLILYPEGNTVFGDDWNWDRPVVITIDDPANGVGEDYSTSIMPGVRSWYPEGSWFERTLDDFVLKPGQTVTATNGYLTKVHVIKDVRVTNVDLEHDTVAGTAEPGTRLEGWIQNIPENIQREGTAGADGNWTLDYAALQDPGDVSYDIVPGSSGFGKNFDEDGDATNFAWELPNPVFDVRANTDQVEAYEWDLGDTLNLRIHRPSMPEDQDYTASRIVTGTADWDPSRTYVSFNLNGLYDIQPGDLVSITNGSISRTMAVAGLAITGADLDTDTVFGTAGAYQNVNTWTCWQNDPCVSRRVEADGAGNWSATFAVPGPNDWEQGTADLRPGSWIDSSLDGPDGTSTMFGWNVPNPTLTVRTVENEVHANDWPVGSLLTLTIDDPSNSQPVDFTASQTALPADWNPATSWTPFRLGDFQVRPGFQVTLSDGTTTKTHPVSGQAVTKVDIQLETVEGSALAGTEVWVDVWGMNASRHVVTDAAGHWAADFSQPGDESWETALADLLPGTNGEARVQDEESDATSVTWQVYQSSLHAVPAHPEVHGHDWAPGEDVTLYIDDDADLDNGSLYTATRNVDQDPWCGNPCFDLQGVFDLKVGQYVTMTDGDIVKTVHVSGLKITQVDAEGDTLRGVADPGSRVAVNIWSQDGKARYVTTDSSGNWTADFSTPGDEDFEQFTTDITYGDNGRAVQLNPDGSDDGTLEYWDIDWVAPPSLPVVYALSQPIDLGLSGLVVESLDVVDTLQDSLFRLDNQGSLLPLAAVDWSVSADGLVYTVHLRPDAAWSDGQPVTAQNFVDGILRMLDPNVHTGYGLLYFPILNAEAFSNGTASRSDVGVRALNSLTLEITLAQKTPHFAQILASPATLPVRQDLIDQYGDAWTSPAHYVSSGPYTLAEYDLGHIVVQKNTHYTGPMPGDFPQIGFDVIPDADAQIAAYKSGDVDVLLSMPIMKTMSDPDLRRDLTVLSSPGVQYLGFSTQVYPTNNPLVRKALASAIDRQAILHDVLQTPWRVAATGVIPPELAGYQGSAVGYSYDPTQARAYLTQAGYPGGQGFPVLHFTAAPNQAPVMQAIADQWQSTLGIDVDINVIYGQPRQEILANCRLHPQTCTYNGYIIGWVVDYPDEYNIFKDLFHPDSFANYLQWDNAAYRSLIQQASSELNPAQRTAYWQQAEKILVEDDAAVAPLYFMDNALVVRPGIYPYYAPTYFTNLAYWSNVDRSGDGLAVEVIGSAGGTVTTESNSLSVAVPPAALQSDVNLSVTDLGGNYQVTASQEELDVLESFSIQPHGLQFDTPVTLTFAWDDSNNDGLVDGTGKLEANIFLLKDGNPVTPACAVNPNCDRNANLLVVEVSSLSHFELVAPVNEPPSNVMITAPTAPVVVSQALTIQVAFTDVDDGNAHTVAVDWGDGANSSASTSTLNAVASHSYRSAGVYTLKATVTDSAGASAQAVYQYVVIYDPNGGFVTGSGWINSPAGAYANDLTLSGKATFGFVSKYLKGANVPTGSTEFQFKVGSLNFKSTTYDWLVIAGTKAQYKGIGTINGTGNYGFMLTATDGSPDRFRIKIWDRATGNLIYDNMPGAAEDANPTTALEGGSVVVHKDK